MLPPLSMRHSISDDEWSVLELLATNPSLDDLSDADLDRVINTLGGVPEYCRLRTILAEFGQNPEDGRGTTI
jgi:transposase